MSNAISVTVPRDAALLLLAAKFLADAAAHVDEHPETLRVLSEQVGDVKVVSASITEDEQKLSETVAAVDVPQLVEVMDDVFVPVDVVAAFSPKPGMFDEPEPPEYEMTEASEGFSREEFHSAGWTDEALIKAGKMRHVVKVPAAPVAAAPTPTPAPMAPPPTSSTAPVPTPAPPTSGATPNVGEVDSKGIPWDSRIHAGTKTKMASDNTWKLKRGVDKAEVERITAQLRQLAGNPAAPAPTSSAPAPAPAPAPTAEKPGAALMRRITGALTGKTLDQATILGAVRHPTVGLKEVRELCLPENAHLVPVAEMLMFPG